MKDERDQKRAFYNLFINTLDKENVFAICYDFFHAEKPHTIFFLNAHCFNIAQRDPLYRNALDNTDLLLNDGIGVTLASYLIQTRFKENLNGTDLIPEILRLAALQGKKVFFLGAKEGIAEKAASCAVESICGLNIVGCASGYFDSEQEKLIIKTINKSGADILILAMGVPKQEVWAVTNKASLKNIKVIIAGGAILDFLSKEVSRAPFWVRKIGMEWLYRLYLEPKRLWKRTLVGNWEFFFFVIRLKYKRGRT